VSFFAVGQWVKRDLAGQAGTSSRTTLETWKTGAYYAQKGSPASSTGHPARLQRNIGKKRQKTMRSFGIG
jgi:hypothetical protein